MDLATFAMHYIGMWLKMCLSLSTDLLQTNKEWEKDDDVHHENKEINDLDSKKTYKIEFVLVLEPSSFQSVWWNDISLRC